MKIELDYTGPVAIFPLPSVVFFPGSLLPLHIFEQRYRELVSDALGGDGLIAIALLAPGWEQDYQGAPEIHAVATLGRMVRHSALDDGRSNILLEGLARIRMGAELPPAPYRTGQIEVLDDRLTLESLEASSGLAQQIDRAVLDLYLIAPALFGTALARPGEAMSPGRYFDRVADALKIDPRIKQALLDETDVEDRGLKLLAILERVLEVASQREDEAEAEERDARDASDDADASDADASDADASDADADASDADGLADAPDRD